ncbi:CbiX/SirB N-terminal domain-containing protein [Rhodopila sp.]|uniref:CbiX/SirB N-terminal domain-containing protein n=1 Tax=Rhodopila sp. TaxID=2480087 RepID=UPI003D110BA9
MRLNDALLLVAHGSARYPDASRIALAQLARIKQAEPMREVGLGLLNGTPSVAEALAGLAAPVVRVVPWFMEDGYFTKVAVPRALAITQPGAIDRLRLCPPVGVHAGMADLIVQCALDGCSARGISPQATTVLVVGHGSARASGRALALHRHVSIAMTAMAFAQIKAACLEEAPFFANALRALRCHTVAVIGFFAGEGSHVYEDVPELIAAEQRLRGPSGPPVHNYGSVTETPEMTHIIMAQASAA